MANQRRWSLGVCSAVLSGVAFGGVLVYGRLGVQGKGESPMHNSRFLVEHVRLETDKPFEEVVEAFERQLGRFDPDVRQAATESGNTDEARAEIAAMAGPSGF